MAVTMLKNVFLKTLRDYTRPLIYWGIGVFSLNFINIIFYPSIKEQQDFNKLFEEAPEALTQLFLGEVRDLTSPEGYLNGQIFIFMGPIIFILFCAIIGSNLVKEEENGSLELLLANPVSRVSVMMQKFFTLFVLSVIFGLISWFSVVFSAQLVDMDISIQRVFEAHVSLTLLGLVFGVMALLVGGFSGKRNLSLGLVAAVGLGSYLLNSLAPLVKDFESFKVFSVFYYYYGANPLKNGLDWGHVLVLILVSAIFLLFGVIFFKDRDLKF